MSLVSVIVTSSAGAGVYLQRHVANLRLGMVLELFTATGALVGGLVAFLLPVQVLEALFAILLAWVAVSMARRRERPRSPVRAPVVANGDGAILPDLDEDMSEAPAATDPAPGSPTARRGDDAHRPPVGPGYRVHRLPFGMVGAAVRRARAQRCWASAAGSSRSPSCTSSWASRCGSRPRPAT